MGDFKKFGGNKSRGGDTFNRGPGGKPGFGGGKPDFRGGDRGERAGGPEGNRREMFKATCAECGKSCEVPFRPSGDRPVYCKDCFQQMGGPVGQDRGNSGNRSDRAVPNNFGSGSRGPSSQFQRREITPRPSYTPPMQGSGEDKRLDDLKIQLSAVISKLDKLITLVGNSAPSTPKATKVSNETLRDTLATVTHSPVLKKEASKAKTTPSKKKSSSKKK